MVVRYLPCSDVPVREHMALIKRKVKYKRIPNGIKWR